MSLGSWFEFGYEGFPEEDKQQFYSQRDDPCDSDEERSHNPSRYGADSRCFSKPRRIRRRFIHRGRRLVDGDDGKEEFDVVHESCDDTSTSDEDDNDEWWAEHDAVEEAPGGRKRCREKPIGSGECSTSVAIPNVDDRVVQLTLSEGGEQFGFGCSAVVMRPSSASHVTAADNNQSPIEARSAPAGEGDLTMIAVHGGIPLRQQPRNPTRNTKLFKVVSTTDSVDMSHLPIAEHRCDAVLCNARALIKKFPPSFRRWTRGCTCPERFGHCTVAIKPDCLPFSAASLLDELLTADADVANYSVPVTVTLSVAMSLTIGGCTAGDIPATLHDMRPTPGFELSDPHVALFIHWTENDAYPTSRQASRSGTFLCWKPVAISSAENVPTPRAFASLCRLPPKFGDGSEFLYYGGTDDCCTPSMACTVLQRLVLDAQELTCVCEDIETLGVAPEPRFGHTMTLVREEYLVHGGLGFGKRHLNDTFVLDAHTFVWREVFVPSPMVVPPRAFHVALPDSGSVIFLGGEGASGAPVRSTWEVYPKTCVAKQVAFPLLFSDLGRFVGNVRSGRRREDVPQQGQRRRGERGLLQDVLHVTNESHLRNTATTFDSYRDSAAFAFGGLCVGACGAAVELPNAGGNLVFGGNQSFAPLITFIPKPRRTLKEVTGLWLLTTGALESAADERLVATDNEALSRRVQGERWLKLHASKSV